MASPRKPAQAIIRSLMRGLGRDQEYRHSRPQGEAAPQYVEIREDANHHGEIEAELPALGYEHAWQRKRWRVCRDSRYVPDFRTDLCQADRPAEEPSAPSPGKGGPHPRAATLGDFMEVARRSNAKPARPLQLKRSGPRSDVELAHRGAPAAQDPPPPAAAVWPQPLMPLSEGKWPARAGASAACPATCGLPGTRLRRRTLRCREPS